GRVRGDADVAPRARAGARALAVERGEAGGDRARHVDAASRRAREAQARPDDGGRSDEGDGDRLTVRPNATLVEERPDVVTLRDLLEQMVAKKASDLHLTAGV